MKEYIEKTAARNAVKRVIGDQDHTCKAMMDSYVALNEAPAADVVEVRHGRWVKPVPGDGENYCSVCKAEQPWFYGYGYFESDYCPSCGARMDKEADHD